MGTRGLFGFRYKKKYYMIYNSYDSYYSYLGQNLINEINAELLSHGNLDIWIELFVKAKILQNTPQIRCQFNDLVQNCSGSYVKYLKSEHLIIEGYCVDDLFEALNSIFIEYVYILDLDENKFIVNKTFEKINREYDILQLPVNLEKDMESL